MVHVTRLAHHGLQARSLSTQAELYNDRWGLERVTLDDIDRGYEDLLARGIEIVTPPTADFEPGVKRALRLRDPDGFVIELFAGIESVNDPFKHADVKPTALNHVVLNVRDQDASEAFYREALGFKLTDRFVGGLSFWACNANHHSLAFGQARDGNSAFHSATICSRITRIPRATPSNTPLKWSRLPIQIASHASWSPIQTSGATRRRTED